MSRADRLAERIAARELDALVVTTSRTSGT